MSKFAIALMVRGDLWYTTQYNILSQTFYESYQAGEESPDDAWVLDWSDWAGAYTLWLERQQQYHNLIQSLRQQMPLTTVIEKAAQRESLAT
jgi:hypothetical protein